MKNILFLFALLFVANISYSQTYPGTQVSNPVRTYTQNDTKGVWVIGNGTPIFSPTAKMSQLYFDYMNQTGYFWNGSAWVAWTNDFLRTASNGLTEDGTDVKLGGTLTEPTTIDLDGNDFIIQGAGTMGFDIIGDIALISKGGVEIRPDSKFEVHTLGNIEIDATQDIVIVTDDVINIQAVNGGSIIADNNDFVLEATAGDVQINSPGTTAGVVNGIAYKSDIANSVAVTDYGINITTGGMADDGKVWTYNGTSNEMELVTPMGVDGLVAGTGIAFSGTAPDITISATGDITPYTVTAPITLTGHDIGHTTSGVTPATYGSQTAAAVVTVDATGHVTGATTTTIIPDVNTIGANQLTSGLRDSITLNNWNLLGNAGTLQATNFLGTTDARGLSFRTNNIIRQTIRSDGQVGIGTIDPQTELHIVSTSASDPRGIMTSQYSTDLLGARLHFRKSRGTESSPTTIVTGDLLGRLRFSGYDGANFLQMGSIDIVSTGTVASTRIPTYMSFSTATDAATSVLTEALRINSDQTLLLSAPSAVSAPALKTIGSWYGSGTTTTSKPHILIEAAGTTSTGWSAVGTGLGVNAVSGFTGNIADFQLNGVSRVWLSATGNALNVTGNMLISGTLNVNAISGLTTVSNNGVWTGNNNTIFTIAGSTANTQSIFNVTKSFTAAGSTTFTGFEFGSTINQAGSGITRGLYINPTLTLASDFRAIDVARGRSIFNGRLSTGKGANVASAGTLTLGDDGNVFHITGTTAITAITTTNWQAGSEITLIFDSTASITAGANMLLAGAANFNGTANDVIKLVWDGTSWFEVSRSIN